MKFVAWSLLAAIVILNPITTSSPNAKEKTLDIAMILWRGETDAERGFKARLEELNYKVNYTTWDAKQDRKVLKKFLKTKIKPILRKYDYVYTFGTTVTKATRVITRSRRVPHIFNVVTYPENIGIDPKKGLNITGVSSRVPLELQIDRAKEIVPFNTLGFIYNPRENNSMAQKIEIEKLGKRSGFTVVAIRSSPKEKNLEESLNQLFSHNIDVLYLPSDSYLISEANVIGQLLKSNKIKSIGSHQTYVDQGALLGFIADYHNLGMEAANIIDRHEKGEKIKDIPINTSDSFE